MNINQEKIRSVVNDYVNGYLKAERSQMEKSFFIDANIYSSENGTLEKMQVKDWYLNLDERKKKNDLRQAKLDILSLDIEGVAAVAKISLTFESFKFFDFLSLLKLNNEWKIVGKIYSKN